MIDIKGLEKKLSPDFFVKIDELHIDKGERIALIGANGSGKSTLLKLLAGIIKPDSGTIEFDCEANEKGYEPQSPFIFKGSARYNISIASKEKTDIKKLAADCELEGLLNKNAALLSGGEKQRVCFARMLSSNYKLLMMDEPLSATDITVCEKLETVLLEQCKKNNTTLLISTHLPSQALHIATKVLIMNNGEIVEYSDIDKLRTPETEFGRKFVSQWML